MTMGKKKDVPAIKRKPSKKVRLLKDYPIAFMPLQELSSMNQNRFDGFFSSLRAKRISAFLIYAVFTVGLIAVLWVKTEYHVDELLTYTLSNQVGDWHFAEEDGKTYSPAEDIYLENFSVHQENRFDYQNVWHNLSTDAHPPVYYALVHTISSLFPGQISKWFAGVINIFFALLSLFFFRKLLRLFSTNECYVGICSITYIFCTGILSAVSFLRVYVTAMCALTAVTYLISNAVAKKSFGFRFWGLLFICEIACALLHYYCVVYLAWICFILAVWLILAKRWKSVLYLVVTSLGAAAAALLIFPSMWKQVFFQYRGKENFDALLNNSVTTDLSRYRNFFEMVFPSCLAA